jgi:hypothetical protein
MKHPPLLERENSIKNVLLLYDEIKKNICTDSAGFHVVFKWHSDMSY